MYCEKCMTLFEGEAARCPACGSRKVRLPVDDDLCFLAEKEALWSAMLADVLEQNAIPCIYKPTLGAALAVKLGQHFEHYRFYVPYAHWEAAQGLLCGLFGDSTATT